MRAASSTKEVLYLSYDGLTDPLGQSQILPYLTGLSGKEYHINIVSFEKTARFRDGQGDIQRKCDEAGIEWLPQVYHKSPPILSTLYDLFVLWRVAHRIVHTKNIAIVHCRSYLTALIGLRIKKRRMHIKLIFDMRGFWADERIEGGIWPLESPVYRFIYNYFKRAERRLIKLSDHVVVLTEAARREILSWNLTDRISVVPCCVDTALFNPARVTGEQRDELRRSLGIGANDFVLLYLGSLGTWYMLDEMLRFFEALRRVNANVKFLLLTPDRGMISGEGIITHTVQRDDVPKHIAIADASVCFIKPSFSKIGSSATKMAEVLAMNVPVVCNKGWGDVEFLVDKVNGLALIETFDEITEDLMSTYRPLPQTEFFFHYFSLTGGIASYQKIYEEGSGI